MGLFKPGPFHSMRHQITKELKQLPIKTGDIFYRESNVWFMCIPFSGLISRLSKSNFSHASIALVENNEIYLVEVNDAGCVFMRLIDWISTCAGNQIVAYRLKEEKTEILEKNIRKFLEEDPDYDFTFNSTKEFYCTESVAYIYKESGVELIKPSLIKDKVPKWFYNLIFFPLNWIILKITGKGMSIENPLFFVGNEKHGLMSSDKTYCIWKKII